MTSSFFVVKKKARNYIFLSLNITDPQAIAQEALNYFFEENEIFNYFKSNGGGLAFSPMPSNYATLYRSISYFVDNTISTTKKDKAGKIGEYFLSILLRKYFHADCIIPKLIHITDQDMPVYGIDTLFYSSERDLLLFGESKFTKNLTDGINLLNKSISEYHEQFNDELRYIVANDGFKKSSNKFLKDFSKAGDCALSFKDFVKYSGIKTIGVPLFVCHGKEINESIIFDKLVKNLKTRDVILGMGVKYVVISLPINDKTTFLKYLKKGLEEKQKDYEKRVK